MTQGQLFDINAILAGSAEVYTAIEDTVPPVLGYPITKSDPGNIKDPSVIGLFQRGTGMTLWDGQPGTTSKVNDATDVVTAIESASGTPTLSLKAITFDISREKPTLRVQVEGNGSDASASKGLADGLSNKSTPETERSLFIQYFGRSAEFPFKLKADDNPNGAKEIVSGDAADPHTTTYVWEIDNESDANRFRAYTCLLYTSPSPRDS